MNEPDNGYERRILVWGLSPLLLGFVVQLPWAYVMAIWGVNPQEHFFDMLPLWIGICFPVGLIALGTCKAMILIAGGLVRAIAKLPRMIREGTFKDGCLNTLRGLSTFSAFTLEALAALLRVLFILAVVIVVAAIAIWAFLSFPVHVGVIVLILILLGK